MTHAITGNFRHVQVARLLVREGWVRKELGLSGSSGRVMKGETECLEVTRPNSLSVNFAYSCFMQLFYVILNYVIHTPALTNTLAN